MCLLIIFFPLLGSVLSGFFGKNFGAFGSSKLTILCIFIALFMSFFLFFEIAFFKSTIFIDLFYWIDSELINIKWSFLFDSLTITMCLTVLFISFLVHFYSIEYMHFDPFLSKFMSYLSLFSFFMLLLVTSQNLIQMFVGWEGVGLCSYLLINFWFTRIQANKAAIKAMILNRIGDFGLLIGILFIFLYFKSLNYTIISLIVPVFKIQKSFFNFNIMDIICFCLLIGVIGKSAQLGLHTWLPDAMEGPTPVSALIHAATMVTAGIFLIIRMSFIFEFSYKILNLLSIIGITTAFVGALIGLVQNDFKKIIAYSTCSQLGYMIFSCGLSDFFVSFFHLTNHAIFKALLFLGSGSVIHSINDEQDIRKMGGLKLLLPFTYVAILIGSLALIGFPFLTGFYSKDFILESAFSKHNLFGYFCYFMGTFVAFVTTFYSIRVLFLVFLSKPNGYKTIICYSKDSGFTIKLVLTVLMFLSVFIGYFNKEMFIGFGSSFFNNSIFINLKLFNLFDIEFIPLFYKLLPVYFSLLIFLIAIMIYSKNSYLLFKFKLLKVFLKIYNFLNRKWFFDKIYNGFFGQTFFKFGYSTSYKLIDKGFFEFIGPIGLSFVSVKFCLVFYKLETKFLHYLLLILLFCVTFLGVFLNLFVFFNFSIVFLSLLVVLFFKIMF